jgi:hypothetical protein
MIFFLATFSSTGQKHYQDYQVYDWETLQRGWAEVAIRNVNTFKRNFFMSYNGQLYSKGGMTMNTANLAYGITDHLQIGFNSDFLSSNNLPFNFYRFRADVLYQFGDKNVRIVNPALYLEYSVPAAGFEEPSRAELRLILMKDAGDFRITLNPAIEKALSGDELDNALETNLYGGFYWRRHYLVQPGLEYIGRFGEINEFPDQNYQPHLFFAIVDLRFLEGFTLNLGLGYGINLGSDDWVGKFGLSYEFQAIKRFARGRRLW